LKEFPPADRPPIVLPFYAFRLMVLLGFLMVFLVLWALWYWFRGRLKTGTDGEHKKFWILWSMAIPMGFMATEMGWIVREVGRQPWIVYNLMRTEEGVTNLASPLVAGSLILYGSIYLALLIFFIIFARRIMKEGPDMEESPPARKINSEQRILKKESRGVR